MLGFGKLFFVFSIATTVAAIQNVNAYDDSYLQQSAGSQFYQEGTAEGKPINEAGCFPTSLAYSMRYQKLIRNPNFANLLYPSSSAESSVDPADWIQYFFKSCQTSSSGTLVSDQTPCIQDYYQQSGYTQSWVYRIGPSATRSPGGEDFDRAFTINDVRNYLKAGYSLIMEVDWLSPDAGSSEQWKVVGGHAIAIIGYDYDNAWGDEKLILKAMDPAKSYYGQTQAYSNLLMENIDAHPDYVIQPKAPNQNYIVTGFGYGPNYQDTALSDQLMIFSPEQL